MERHRRSQTRELRTLSINEPPERVLITFNGGATAVYTLDQSAQYTQIGITSLRDPLTGEFTQSIPLYVNRSDLEPMKDADVDGLTNCARALGEKFRAYKRELRQEGLE